MDSFQKETLISFDPVVAPVQAAFTFQPLVINQWIEHQRNAIVILMAKQRLTSIFRVCHIGVFFFSFSFYTHTYISSLIELAVRKSS